MCIMLFHIKRGIVFPTAIVWFYAIYMIVNVCGVYHLRITMADLLFRFTKTSGVVHISTGLVVCSVVVNVV